MKLEPDQSANNVREDVFKVMREENVEKLNRKK